MRIWVDGWQLRCCGEPFSIGSRIGWSLVAADHDYLAVALGPETAAEVEWAEEHHHRAGDPRARRLVGDVLEVAAVRCAFVPSPRYDGADAPVVSTAHLSPLVAADGFDPDHGTLRLIGYLVTVAPV
jgi:hypothetical protein